MLKYLKSYVAALVAFLTSVQTALDGGSVTQTQWITLGIGGVLALLGVWAVPNAAPGSTPTVQQIGDGLAKHGAFLNSVLHIVEQAVPYARSKVALVSPLTSSTQPDTAVAQAVGVLKPPVGQVGALQPPTSTVTELRAP